MLFLRKRERCVASNKIKIKKTIQTTKDFLSSPGDIKDPDKVVGVQLETDSLFN